MSSKSSNHPVISNPTKPAANFWLGQTNRRVFLNARGGGFSTFGDYLLNAWSDDYVDECGGWYIYLRDLNDGQFWTASASPVPGQNAGHVAMHGAMVCIQREHHGIATRTDICLTTDGALELRRVHLSNLGNSARQVEVTIYVEVVLNHPADHASHPAFSKLFVQTEWHPDGQTLLARRRPRSNTENHPCVAMTLLGHTVSEWETERARFIGRGHDCHAPVALTHSHVLSGSTGSVLDPALALRTFITLNPGETCTLCFVIGVAPDRTSLLHAAADWKALEVASLFEQAQTASSPCDASAAVHVGSIWAKLTQGQDPVLQGCGTESVRPSFELATRPSATRQPLQPLQFFNGYGGFSADGNEYVIRLPYLRTAGLQLPPMPWTNVLANPQCGCIVSEKGAGTVWAGNSREHRLTPWRNDPITDPHDDAWYVRDNDSGVFWSPLPGPAPAQADYEVRHGFGYSIWHLQARGLEQEACMFVPQSDPVRVLRLRLKNSGTRPRRLSVYAYNRWVLGVTPEATYADLEAQFDTAAKAVCARNPQSGEYSQCVAFAAVNQTESMSWTAVREAFLGNPGSMAAPEAVRHGGVLNHSIGKSTSAALQVLLDIAPGETRELSFFVGEVKNDTELQPLLKRYRTPGAVDAALESVREFWRTTVGGMQIETPCSEIDIMVNGWLPYQNLACRMWGRTAFYQSGGAYGFRDQLQDATSLIYLRPDLTRLQILTNAAHQFVEGDVLHWWHPPLSKGMRTRFADDLLWLPYLTAYYITTTGDETVMQEQARFITADFLEEDEDERLLLPQDSFESADVYEHCCRAIDRSLTKGVHGIPLFGCGDWNDGMNRVGREGKGESVWMGFFLYSVLNDFLPWCDARHDKARAQRYRKFRSELLQSLNDAAWDGDWYRRAWYDNGEPLGSKTSDECKIDALAQSWAVISSVASPERANQALNALEQHLINDGEQLIRLLTPAFENTPNDPGYIKGYVAGVRENGGQYTHAALWVVKAMAMAGRRERATQLLKMLSPISHSSNTADADRYKVEPYVIAADIYGVAPHVGSGGWTWYTGSAGWMIRVAIESILGFTLRGGNTLRLAPGIPDDWPGFKLRYTLEDGTQYEIDVSNPLGNAEAVLSATLDGALLALSDNGVSVPLRKDGAKHALHIVMGKCQT
jgi:cyclic beta-1,2-glucan synthetase